MKPILFCLMASAASLCAQPALEARLTKKIVPCPVQFGEVDPADQKVVVQKVTTLLTKHVNFRSNDQAATSIDAANGRHQVEWMGLRIKMLVPVRTTDQDQKNGISKRIQAMLDYDTTRSLNLQTKSWGPWGKRGHPLFPRSITVEWRNGHAIALGGPNLGDFQPGPASSRQALPAGPTVGDPIPTPGTPSNLGTGGTGIRKLPGSGASGLPPGMTRGK